MEKKLRKLLRMVCLPVRRLPKVGRQAAMMEQLGSMCDQIKPLVAASGGNRTDQQGNTATSSEDFMYRNFCHLLLPAPIDREYKSG